MNKGFYSFITTILCFLFIIPLSSQTPTASFATWKDNKKAAYSIIHDDYSNYVPGIFQYAYPIAKARGIKICFGAITGFCDAPEWSNARTMIADGNECVNHSHNHKCGGTAGQCSGLTTYGIANFATELDLSTQLIETNTAVRPRFFIHPYDAPSDAIINYLKNTLGYLGARSGNQLAVNSSNFTDFMRLNYYVYDGTASALAGLNTAVDAAISSGGYVVREFHGIDDGSWAAMTQANYTSHLNYVKSKMDDGSIWSATTTEAITYKMQRDAFQPAVTYDATAGTVTVNFNSLQTINTAVLRTPVTVNVNLNGIAGTYTVAQNGTAVLATRVGNNVSFNVYPHQGVVTLNCTDCSVTPPQPVDVTNLAATPQQISVGLTWTNPAAFDEIRVVAQTSAISGSATSYTTTGDFTTGKIVYSSTGANTSVTGLTASTQYYFKTFTRLGTLWSSGISVTTTTTAVTPPSQPANILNFAATPQTNAATLAWTNPTTNYDEVMIVAKPTTGFISTPGGTAYTADANFTGAGTIFEGGKVIYKGIGTNVNVTNLAGGTRYYFRAYSRLGTIWSTGVEVSAIPNSPAVITPIPGCLQASYFTNIALTGTPALVRGEAKIDNNWAAGAPATGIPADNFSVRWEGIANPPVTGNYVFTVTVDDGVRLWINNVQVIDKWIDQASTTYTANVALTQGQSVPVRMEYYERGGSAVAKLAWTIPTLASQPIAFDATCPIVQPPVAGFDAAKCYRMIARHSNKHLEITSNSTSNNIVIQQDALKANDRGQTWRIKNFDGTHYQISNGFSGKLITVANSSTANNAVIYQYANQNTNNQKWAFEKNTEGYYFISPKHAPDKVIDITGASTANKANAIQYVKTGSTNQQWTVSETACPANTAALESSRVIAFEGRYENGKALLKWVVKSEDLMDYFDIEKANEAGEFKSLKVINGTSVSELREFAYSDENLIKGDNYYRLTTVASDGSSQTSQIVNVKYAKPDAYAVYPNPANDYFSLDLSILDGQPVDISIMDAVGKIVKTEHIDSAPLSQRFEIGELENGQYFVRIQSKGKKMTMKKLRIIK